MRLELCFTSLRHISDGFGPDHASSNTIFSPIPSHLYIHTHIHIHSSLKHCEGWANGYISLIWRNGDIDAFGISSFGVGVYDPRWIDAECIWTLNIKVPRSGLSRVHTNLIFMIAYRSHGSRDITRHGMGYETWVIDA